MTLQSNSSKMLADWAGDLACPACHRTLALEPSRIVCTGCGRVYPIVDGIPVLIAERAEQPGQPGPK